jgi:hypothetical protein
MVIGEDHKKVRTLSRSQDSGKNGGEGEEADHSVHDSKKSRVLRREGKHSARGETRENFR